MKTDCPHCGGPVAVVAAGLIGAHGLWVMRPGGMAETPVRCPASLTVAPREDVQPTAAHVVLLEQVADGRVYLSPVGVPRFSNGQRLDRKVFAEVEAAGWLAVDGRRPVVTESGESWLTRLT